MSAIPISLKHNPLALNIEEVMEAIVNEEFILYYQPKMNLTTGEISGVEALLRWQHPRHGFLAPDQFIPYLEQTTLIIPVGEWVIKKACIDGQLLNERSHHPIKIAINLSSYQLRDPAFIERLEAILLATHINPNVLDFEITETVVMDIQKASDSIHAIERLGIGLSLDDFGTGFSSLVSLRDISFDTLKIDRSFVNVQVLDDKNTTILKAVIAMAKQLNVTVIAEGVETEAQLKILAKHACDEIQGYLLSRPLSMEQLQKTLPELKQRAANLFLQYIVKDHAVNKQEIERSYLEISKIFRQQHGTIIKLVKQEESFIITFCEDEILDRLNIPIELILGRKIHEIMPSTEANFIEYHYQQAWENNTTVSFENVYNNIHFFATVRPIVKNNKVVELMTSFVNVTKLFESEQRFSIISENFLSGVVICLNNKIVYANRTAMNILNEDEVLGLSLKKFLPKDISISCAQQQEDAKVNYNTFETELILTSGEVLDIEMAVSTIPYERQQAQLVLFKDETRRKAAERIFLESDKKLTDINHALNESSIVAITDRRGRITFVNEKFIEISKYTKEELLGQDHHILNSGFHPKAFFKEMWRTIGTGHTWVGEIRNKKKDGTFYWVKTTVVPFLDERDKPYQYISIRTDITERKNMEEALRKGEEKLLQMAFRDTLTGIPNRRHFLSMLDDVLEDARLHDRKFAVVYFDMDGLKTINDTYGHEVGDQAIIIFTERVNHTIPKHMSIARLGGDEFTMIIPIEQTEEEAIVLIEKIFQHLQNKLIGDFAITASAGIAFYPKDAKGRNKLLACADKALYYAKSLGKNNYQVYNKLLN